ncbi:MAG: membrane dipeptidase [Prevotella sp.]|nr:membrane dipeptidase [Prevotella sp.]
MNSYDIEAWLDPIYKRFPEGDWRPVVGITTNYADGDATLREKYYKMVVRAGGVPMLIPPVSDAEVILNTLETLDALLLTGGGDYDPRWANEAPSSRVGTVNTERDLPELLITRLTFNRQLPMLGICRGMQTLAMALGGRLAQDIEEAFPEAAQAGKLLRHSQEEAREVATHEVEIAHGSRLFSLFGKENIRVNSFHHQAVLDGGARFSVAAKAPDGVIEAMESSEEKPIIGVQWHPEWLADDGLPLFTWLVGEAQLFADAKQIHRETLTIDSHCDTPMFFPQDINFAHRDHRILVDLHKMAEGRLDATTMVAYIPQPKPAGKTTVDNLDYRDKPKAYADKIFDKIEQIAAENHDFLALARTPDDLKANKAKGRKSIVLGIENGHALEGRLENVAHFASRGVTYVTLCHNGDNAICDSARTFDPDGGHLWGGLSPFGRQAIAEMNRQGIMVDLSHAAESSFYEALETSATPIVCSHSSCRSLCNHPRNLTDQQMKALADRGGVMQITLYNGFLVSQGKATINDAMAHLEHAISIMGTDHVGLGTDFDGDGGIIGLADASELINFTRQLLLRRYSKEDIGKIWGGNWLRVMSLVQKSKTARPESSL